MLCTYIIIFKSINLFLIFFPGKLKNLRKALIFERSLLRIPMRNERKTCMNYVRSNPSSILQYYIYTGSSEAKWTFLDGSHLNKNNVSD